MYSFFLYSLLFFVISPVGADALDDVVELSTERRQLLATLRAHAPSHPYIVIDTQDNRLQLRAGDQILREAVCATGSGRKLEGDKKWHRWQFATPKGRFGILRKVEDPLWIRPTWDFIENGEDIPIFAEDRRRFQYGVLGEFALYFARDYMIHGTLFEVNLGKSITHGCVRLGAEDLRYLYDEVKIGWPVFIY
jgi:lipoprotein-anchoring transpeptidase ErfK/SrfK